MLKQYPMIHPQCEKESLFDCPKSIYDPVKFGDKKSVLRESHVTSGLLGQFCITSTHDPKSNDDVAWKLKDIRLEDCNHDMPRYVNQ